MKGYFVTRRCTVCANNYCDMACSNMLIYWTGREDDANAKSEKKQKENDKSEEKGATAGDDSGSDKEIVKEWRTRSRGLEKGTLICSFKWFFWKSYTRHTYMYTVSTTSHSKF